MKPLRVEFDMTRDDLAAAVEVAVDRDPGVRMVRRKTQRVFAGLILFVVAVQAAAFILVGPGVARTNAAFSVAGIFLLIWLWPTRRTMLRGTRRNAAARYSTPAGKAYLGPRSVELTRDGLAVSSGFGSSLFIWPGVIDVTPTRTHLVVTLPGPTYLCIPRRAFDSDNEFEHFGEVMTELAEAGGGLTGRVAAP